MLRLAFYFLLVKSAFAANAFPLEQGSYGPVGPDTNLVYNFEQIRRDQPPQVELREENIHKYMGRPRTTTPVPEISSYPVDDGDMSPMRPQHPLPYNALQWSQLQKAPKYEGPMQNWKSVPAPPNFPQWDSLSNLAVTNPNNYETQPAVPQQPIVVPSEAPAQWSEPEVRSQPPSPSYTSIPTAAPPKYTPTMSPAMPMREPVARIAPRANPTPSRRGGQRFNWHDAMNLEPSSTPAPTQATTRMPPPAVPTLSPWYDGF